MEHKILKDLPRIKAFFEAANVVTDTRKGQPGFMLAWGVSGRGKTECARQFCLENNAVYMRFQQGWTPLEMLKWLCKEMNGMEPKSIARTKYVIQEELDATGKSIVVDEADRLSIDHFEHFRDLFDNIGTPIIFVGETSLFEKLSAHRRFIKRITRSIEVGPVTAEDVIKLGMGLCSLKIKPVVAVQMANKSQGSISEIKKYLYELEKMAANNEDNWVTEEMFKAIPERITKPKGTKIK